MRRFNTSDPGFEPAFTAFLDERRGTDDDVDAAVAEIIARVRAEGLAAVLDYTRRFDRVDLTEATVAVTAEEIAAGAAACEPDVLKAIDFAAARIRSYHERQRPADAWFTDEAGVELGWRWTPLEAVGVYVPGGRAARFSSGLSIYDFIKRTSIVKCDPASFGRLAPSTVALAEAEGLPAHARSASIRLNSRG